MARQSTWTNHFILQEWRAGYLRQFSHSAGTKAVKAVKAVFHGF
jgi:hypothetical protein